MIKLMTVLYSLKTPIQVAIQAIIIIQDTSETLVNIYAYTKGVIMANIKVSEGREFELFSGLQSNSVAT